jgi:hypothetical protein
MKTFTTNFTRTYVFSQEELQEQIPNFENLTEEEQIEQAEQYARNGLQHDIDIGGISSYSDDFAAETELNN